MNELNQSGVVVRRSATIYEIDEDTNNALHDAIVAGTVTLPEFSIVTLITTANVKTTKFVSQAGTWAQAQPVGDSSASRTAVTALTPDASPTATDLATALVMVNSLKTKVNAIISALKA